MKRVKPFSAVVAAALTLSTNALSAVSANTGALTNHSDSAMTSAADPAQIECGNAAEASRFSGETSTNALALALTTVSSEAQSFSADVCCIEPRVVRSDFAFRADELTGTSRNVSAHKTVHFLNDAVISVGRSSDSAERRNNAPATWSRFPSCGSLAGGDSAATRVPRSLRFFSWNW